MRKVFSLGALLMLAMCAGFVCSCNDDVEETPPATVTPPSGDATEDKDTHEYVDLGLPSGTLWATCNVGANSPEEYGDYFAWAETEPKTTYDWSTYKYYNGTTMTKYCAESKYGTVDNKTELEAMDDAATVNWGADWQIPSREQFEELINSSCTTTKWTTMNGENGRKITSKSNGNSIFLPAAGRCEDTSLYDAGSYGYYHSRTVGVGSVPSSHSIGLRLYSSRIHSNGQSRYSGHSVRPVRVKESIAVSNIEISKTELSVKVGATSQLSAIILPENATNKAVVWASSNADVATVDETGKVFAVALGICTITCSATDGSSVKAECKVTVIKNDNSGTLDGHEYVDLDLPSGTLWATCNVGASKPEEYGDYFAWGEAEPKSDYSWSTYKYCQGIEPTMTKYCTISDCGIVDNKTELEAMDDAATVNWGSDWQMPSPQQLEELINNSYTTTAWTTMNGKYGRMITSKSNGNSIFLPAAGSRDEVTLNSAGSIGCYWSSLNTGYSIYAFNLSFDSGNIYTYYFSIYSRFFGLSVRPIRVKK
ncbi:MAG: Ig-like domain-containing protein [Bacteroidaceae bacterium]|nr:Ig-like domain-containing protein [Bacteroidaceae bacterium]